MFKVRIAQRGITLFISVYLFRGYGIRARIGTWTYGSPFPGRPISDTNKRVRAWTAWYELCRYNTDGSYKVTSYHKLNCN